MARMRTDNKEKIRQLKRDIKDMKKDLKDTFADVPDTPQVKKRKRSVNIALRIVLYVVVFAILAAAAYLIWRFGIIF